MLSRLMLFKRSFMGVTKMPSSGFSGSSSISKDQIVYRRLTPSDEDITVDLMKRQFIKNDVINKYILKYNEAAIAADAHRLKNMLTENVSIGAFHKDKLIGMSIQKHDAKFQHFEEYLPRDMRQDLPPEWLQVCTAFNTLYKEFYEKVNPKCVVESQLITVEPAYNGLGLSTEMGKRGAVAAIEKGCDYMMTISCTKAVEMPLRKAGFKKLGEINYSEYKDPKTGLRPFQEIPSENPSSILFYSEFQKLLVDLRGLKV